MMISPSFWPPRRRFLFGLRAVDNCPALLNLLEVAAFRPRRTPTTPTLDPKSAARPAKITAHPRPG
jgi:hypothetical protein